MERPSDVAVRNEAVMPKHCLRLPLSVLVKATGASVLQDGPGRAEHAQAFSAARGQRKCTSKSDLLFSQCAVHPVRALSFLAL